MNLFDFGQEQEKEKKAPLAARMRPRTLDEMVGQSHILGPGKLLRRSIEADQLSSIILSGPPGTGKTTLAKVIANTSQAQSEQLNAVTAGVGDIRRLTLEDTERLRMYSQCSLLFIDEIHRFNMSQQDAYHPYVEDGTFILIGATTENPPFEVNSSLSSLARIFQLQPLSEAELKELADR